LFNFDAILPCEIRESVAGRKSVEPTRGNVMLCREDMLIKQYVYEKGEISEKINDEI
jgi:hypothetical protein